MSLLRLLPAIGAFQAQLGTDAAYALAYATKATSTTSKTKDAKPEKKPLKAPSAYNLFVKAKFPEVKAQHPGAQVDELMKQLGQHYRSLGESEKQAYKNEAAKIREEGGLPPAKKQKEKDPNRLLAPYRAYVSLNFSTLQNANPGLPTSQIMAKLGQSWRSIPQAEKDRMSAEYAAAKEAAPKK